ncbi:related to aldo/keto reductase family proteins [Armillaria ostoyae]|uniref:Related to aldo/keto reductase family proteins n=1 Tax=Armillaria ostoyae TaxID=47428 RepID=A0A284RGB4_ARMOS|nr:related to aldo/keto reductase family proteins [Armillaria ostoyae]
MAFGTVPLNDGTEIPLIAYGTGSVWKFQDVVPYVEQALETGFSHIDTAAYYQTEEGVGIGIKESGLDRKSLYIATKFSGGDIQQEVRKSLTKLGLKYVDLYLVHSPRLVTGSLENAWKELEKIKEDGLSKSIGVSNFEVEHLEQVVKTAKVVPAVNQINLHPYNYAEAVPVLEYCKKHGIIVEAYSSLTPITKAPGGPVDGPVSQAAQRRNATPAQVLQLWVLSKGAVIVTTSSKKERLLEYLSVADLPPLTKEEIAAIDAAGALGPPGSSSIRALAARLRVRPWHTVALGALLLIAGFQRYYVQ